MGVLHFYLPDFYDKNGFYNWISKTKVETPPQNHVCWSWQAQELNKKMIELLITDFLWGLYTHSFGAQ